jgi:hypothetical protein
LINVTISGNHAGLIASNGSGGGIYNISAGTMNMTNVTVANNSADSLQGDGIYNVATATLLNTLVGNNDGQNCAGGGTLNATYSLSSDTSCSFSGSHNLTNINPVIGPLASNGGPTQTHALLAGSPAMDAADPASFPATDQRGLSRPQGARADIGSFELASAFGNRAFYTMGTSGNDTQISLILPGSFMSYQSGGGGDDMQYAYILNSRGSVSQYGGTGNDYQLAQGYRGSDFIYQSAGDGNDYIYTDGGDGNDYIIVNGGTGDDTIIYNLSNGWDSVFIDGGPGEDTLTINASEKNFRVYNERGQKIYQQGIYGSMIHIRSIEHGTIVGTGGTTLYKW